MTRLILATILPFLLGSGEASRYRLETFDGVVLVVDGPVESRGGILVFRDESGVLSSIPESAVAAIERIEEPSRPRRSESTERHEELAPAPRVLTNDDLPEPLATWTTLDLPDAPPPSEIEPLTYDTYRDREGRGEAWWRERAATLEAEVDAAREVLDAAQRDYEGLAEAWGILPPSDWRHRGSARLRYALREASERRDEAAERLDRAIEARDALAEEARTAGALPGWLR